MNSEIHDLTRKPMADSTLQERYEGLAEQGKQDLRWVINGVESYTAMVAALPAIFSWTEQAERLGTVETLSYSASRTRFKGFISFLELHSPNLAVSVTSSTAELPAHSLAKMMMAPETLSTISAIRNSPVESVKKLCGFVNAEYLLQRPDATAPHAQWSALGDYYHPGGSSSAVLGASDTDVWNASDAYMAPCLSKTMVLDFVSPNTVGAQSSKSTAQMEPYNLQEQISVRRRLDQAFLQISLASPAAAELIRRFVKVIVLLKAPSGYGSTSNRSFPGRVSLRGVEHIGPAQIASSLLHEAIHQFMYIIEFEGRFVVTNQRCETVSLWSGRKLPVDNFIHACFVWFGLTQFWKQAKQKEAFSEHDIARELNQSLAGFTGDNPLDGLLPHPNAIRVDVLNVARSLQAHVMN